LKAKEDGLSILLPQSYYALWSNKENIFIVELVNDEKKMPKRNRGKNNMEIHFDDNAEPFATSKGQSGTRETSEVQRLPDSHLNCQSTFNC